MMHRSVWRARLTLLTCLMGPSGAWAQTSDPIEACPKKGSLRGAAPPDGLAQWCEAVDLFGVVRKNGPFKTWHPNGRLKLTGEFLDGEKHGTWIAYDERGRVALEQRYHFGKLEDQVRRRRTVRSRRIIPTGSGVREASEATDVSPEELHASAPNDAPQPQAITRPHEETDFTDFVGTAEDGTSAMEIDGRLSTEFTLHAQTDLNIFSNGFEANFAFDPIELWAQWGFAVFGTQFGTNVESLNPAFFVGYVRDFFLFRIRAGTGISIPVHGLDQMNLNARELPAFAAAPPKGFYDLWLYLPEFPVVAAPVRMDMDLSFLTANVELTPNFAIPTQSGTSTELNLQGAVELAYPVLEALSVGTRVQLVALAVTGEPRTFFGIEPSIKASYRSLFLRFGFLFNVVTPEALRLGTGLMWGANLRVGVDL